MSGTAHGCWRGRSRKLDTPVAHVGDAHIVCHDHDSARLREVAKQSYRFAD
jgi:hypothetical protein